ncbi:MAG: cysteine desulfurase family protein [Candidatus Omnitrophota bacterium]
MSNRQIYMDHNATTPLHPEVKKAITHAMEIYGNASSLHSFGRLARKAIEEAREKVSSFINARPDDVIFVGSGSEANNTVLNISSCAAGVCSVHQGEKKDIITTRIEHPCIMETAKCLTDRGANIHYIGVDKSGKVDIDELKSKLSEKTGIVSVMMANNEIGTIQDIKKITEMAHEYGALVHTDAVQAVGKIGVDVDDLGVDFLSLSAHKIYGPKGIGALFIKPGVPFCPLIRGGHQERGRRAGTENTIGIIGLSKAVDMRAEEMEEEGKRLLELKAALKKSIEDKICDVHFNGHPTDCLAGTLNVSFDGAEGESILLGLDLEGIAVSTGSACASGSLDPSHVLLATGIPVERVHNSIRVSLGRDNTIKDIEYFIDKLPKVIDRIRNMSTAYTKMPQKRKRKSA